MKKISLIRYIKRESTPQEREMVESWIESSPINKRYFTQLKDTYILTHLSNKEATDDQMKIAQKITMGGKRNKYYIVSKKILFLSYSVAALIFIALVTNISLMLLNNKSNIASEIAIIPENREYLSDIPVDYKHIIFTNKGVKGNVQLPDGTKVLLNSESEIMFPDKFTGSTREVYLSGEAFFDVIKNPDVPMIISTNKNLTIKVLGTKLNVRSYENEKNAKATLISGKIDILSKNERGEDILLAQMQENESLEIKNDKFVKTLNENTSKLTAWTKGNLVFEKTSLDQVLRDLERWHGATFIVEDNSIYNLKLSATFKQESLIQVLEILKFCTGVKFELKENTATLWLSNKKS